MPCASEHSGTGRKTIFFPKFPIILQGNNVIIQTKIFLINIYKKGADKKQNIGETTGILIM